MKTHSTTEKKKVKINQQKNKKVANGNFYQQAQL